MLDEAGSLPDQPKAGHGEVAIEGVGQSDSRALHDREAGRIDCRELVQVGAAKVVPCLLQIAQFARKDLHGAGIEDGVFPRQGCVAGARSDRGM